MKYNNIIHKIIIIIIQYNNIIRQGGKVRKIQGKTRQGKGQGKARRQGKELDKARQGMGQGDAWDKA
jgi:hypothetical protein